MSKDFYYIKETSNVSKITVFLTSLFIVIIIVGIFIALLSIVDDALLNKPGIKSIKDFIMTDVKEITPIGLFYIGLGGGIFFMPIPHEPFYYYGLVKGNSILFSLFTINAGFFLAQILNYLMGLRLSKIFRNLVSKKDLYKVRRFINKHGGIGVFFFNLLFLPAPLLTFALGITRYNVYRLFFYTFLGTALKYAAMIIFFILIN